MASSTYAKPMFEQGIQDYIEKVDGFEKILGPRGGFGAFGDWRPELREIAREAGAELAHDFNENRGQQGPWIPTSQRSLRHRKMNKHGDGSTLVDTEKLFKGVTGHYDGAPYSAFAMRKMGFTMGPDLAQVPYAGKHNYSPNARRRSSGQINRPYLSQFLFERDMKSFIRDVILDGVKKRLKEAGFADT